MFVAGVFAFVACLVLGLCLGPGLVGGFCFVGLSWFAGFCRLFLWRLVDFVRLFVVSQWVLVGVWIFVGFLVGVHVCLSVFVVFCFWVGSGWVWGVFFYWRVSSCLPGGCCFFGIDGGLCVVFYFPLFLMVVLLV